jgi:hypothetical protein
MAKKPEQIFYPSPGHCIYCGATGVKLTDEHIIPIALNGEHVLRDSSCNNCKRKIDIYESLIVRTVWRPYRAKMDFYTRRPKERSKPHELRVRQNDSAVTIPVMAADHPSTLVLSTLPPPRLLSPTAAIEFEPRVFITDYQALDAALTRYPRGVSGGRFHFDPFARLLAKIAHGMIYAGIRSDPVFSRLEFLLPGIIIHDADPFLLVGGTRDDLPAEDATSVIDANWITIDGVPHLALTIRLFAYNAGSPVYQVVAARVRSKVSDHLGVTNRVQVSNI